MGALDSHTEGTMKLSPQKERRQLKSYNFISASSDNVENDDIDELVHIQKENPLKQPNRNSNATMAGNYTAAVQLKPSIGLRGTTHLQKITPFSVMLPQSKLSKPNNTTYDEESIEVSPHYNKSYQSPVTFKNRQLENKNQQQQHLDFDTEEVDGGLFKAAHYHVSLSPRKLKTKHEDKN